MGGGHDGNGGAHKQQHCGAPGRSSRPNTVSEDGMAPQNRLDVAMVLNGPGTLRSKPRCGGYVMREGDVH